MSAILKSTNRISPDDYLEGEKFAEFRHEYADGYVYAMAGASDVHNRITGNLFAVIHAALRGKRCEPFSTDMKVKIPPTFADVFYYPDVMVVCDPTDNSKYYRERPSVIFEVISPETERTDRREKAIAYRQIPSIQAYVLVEQDRVAATVLLRADQGWQSEMLEKPGSVIKLPAIGVEIPLQRIYERTSLAGARPQTD
jgi:Uma2 family endonuclease